MLGILIGLVLFGIALLVLAIFARGGATETVTAPTTRAEVLHQPIPEIGRLIGQAFRARGFTVVSQSLRSDACDLILEDRSPLTGQRLYLRVVPPGEAGTVDSGEVQAALERARGEQLGRAIVATPGVFSDEARARSDHGAVELLDGAALALLFRTLPADDASAHHAAPPVQHPA